MEQGGRPARQNIYLWPAYVWKEAYESLYKKALE